MDIFKQVAILVVVAGTLQSAGVSLASATASNSRISASERSHEFSTTLSQYSDNPTIPGDGTPQRSQGSGTR